MAVGVSYGTDMNVALGAIDEVLRANPHVLQDPAPGIAITRLADSSVVISVNPWVNVPDYIAAVGEVNKAILETFRARNVVIPFPQREVRMVGGKG